MILPSNIFSSSSKYAHSETEVKISVVNINSFSSRLTKNVLLSLVLSSLLLHIPVVSAASLTSVRDIPWSSDVSASTKHTVNFTTVTTIPANGKIIITFPAGFNVSGAGYNTWSGFNGGNSVNISGQVVTITRDNTGTSSTAGAKYIVLSGITNSSTVATTYTVTVETQDASSVTLDGPTTSSSFSLTSTNDGLDTNAPWPKSNADYRNTAQGKTAGPEYPAIQWVYGSGYADSNTSIVQDADGNLYFGGNRMISLTSSGVLRWETAISAHYYYPALAANGTLYGMNDSYLRAYNKGTGAELWSYNISASDNYNTGVVIGPDGTVYVFGRYGTDYAINSDGTLKWSSSALSLNTRMTPSFAIDPSTGEMIIAGENGFKRLYPDGRTKGTASANNFVNDPPVLASDGSAYSAGRNGGNGLFAMNSDGSLKWSVASLGGTNGVSGMSSDDTRFFTRSGSYLYSINTSSGSIGWTSSAIGGFTWTADLAIDPFNETVYFGNDSRKQSDGTLQWRYAALGNCDFPSIGKDGMLYCLQYYSSTNSVFAIKPWTVAASVNTTYYKPGDTMTITAVSSMLRKDPSNPVEDNKIQAVMPNGDKVLLSYASSASGNTTWTGSYTIPADTPSGSASITIQASQYQVQTDIPTNFATAPTGSNNTGITATISYVVDSDAPNGAIVISGGSTIVHSPTVILSINASDISTDITGMMLSNSDQYIGGVWEPYSTTKSWTLSAGDGDKHVYVKFKDSAENISEVYSDFIVLDTTTPDTVWTSSTGETRTFSFDSVGDGVVSSVSSDNLYTDDTLPTFSFTKAGDSTSGIDRYQILLQKEGSEGFTMYIDNIYPDKPGSGSDTSDKTREDEERHIYYGDNDMIQVRSKKESDRLTAGAYKFKVRVYDRTGNYTDSPEKILRVRSHSAVFSTHEGNNVFPLTLLMLGEKSNLNITSLDGNSIPQSLSISSLTPTFYGIANSGATVYLELLTERFDPSVNTIRKETFLKKETIVNGESRYGINLTTDDALTPGSYFVHLVAQNEQKDYVELPEFTLKVGAYTSPSSPVLGVSDEDTDTTVEPNLLLSPTQVPQRTIKSKIPEQTPSPTPTPKTCILFDLVCW